MSVAVVEILGSLAFILILLILLFWDTKDEEYMDEWGRRERK